MDCSLPGSSVHGIFQAGVLERDAIAFSVTDSIKEFLNVRVYLFFKIDCTFTGSIFFNVLCTTMFIKKKSP